jgi:gas vesicle protein
MPTRDFWIGFITGTVFGAVGYRLYEHNNGQLQRLVQVQPLGEEVVIADYQPSTPSTIESTSNIIKKGIENATDATQRVLEKASDTTQSAVDSTSKMVKEFIDHIAEPNKKDIR